MLIYFAFLICYNVLVGRELKFPNTLKKYVQKAHGQRHSVGYQSERELSGGYPTE
jgi:hypothetical protein